MIENILQMEGMLTTSDGKLKPEVVALSEKITVLAKNLFDLAVVIGKVVIGVFKATWPVLKYTAVGIGVVTTVVSALGQTMIEGASIAKEVTSNIATNFKILALNINQIASNIRLNVMNMFTEGFDFRPVDTGLLTFRSLTGGATEEATQNVKDIWAQAMDDLVVLTDSGGADVGSSLAGVEDALNGLSLDGSLEDSLNGAAGAAGGASSEAKDLQNAVEKLEETYGNVEETAVAALDNVKKKTEETLNDLDKKITEIYSKMEEATRDFMEGNAQSNENLASAYVEQEDKVSSLLDSIKEKQQEIQELQDEMASEGAAGQDTSGTQDQIASAEEDLAALQESYDKELEALQSFADQAQELQAQIDEARRRAQLTDFERTVEDINKEKEERQKAFDERMLQLTNELLAIQDQKAKIVALEQQTTATLNALRQQAATIYEGILENMSVATAEEVQKMIDLLKSLEEQTGATGGENLNTSISDILGSGSTTNNVSVSINVSQASEDLSTEELAQYIIDEITRQLQLQTMSSSA